MRRAELGERLTETPEPWLMRHLGPPPRETRPELQALLTAEYSRRAGIAGSYREAAGITDPHQAVRWEGHRGNPELEALRQDAIRTLEIRSEEYDLAHAARGELEGRVLAGIRVTASAPRDVSGELKATTQARQNMRIASAEAQVNGEDPGMYAQAEAELETASEVLAEQDAAYQEWSESTAQVRETAGLAQAELTRRSMPEPAEIDEPETTPEIDEPVPEAEPQAQAEAEIPA
jgi:hypothetical protein